MFVQLFGEVVVEIDGTRRPISRAQASIVFARLVLERQQGTRRAELAHTVWEDDLPSTWGSALRNLLSVVRRFTETLRPDDDDRVETDDGRYTLSLSGPVTVDIERFFELVSDAQNAILIDDHEHALAFASAALDISAGSFLPACGAEWARQMRQSIDDARACCHDVGCSSAMALGRLREAEALARSAINMRPHAEPAYRSLMVTQQRQGNRAEALETYALLRRKLVEDIGVDPSPETESLYVSLLGGDDESQATLASTSLQFVGRDSVVSAISSAWSQLDHTGARVVHLVGEEGIGKTRTMVEGIRPLAVGGAQVLFGCTGDATSGPYHPLLSAIASFLASVPEDDRPRFNPTTARILDQLLADDRFEASAIATEVAIADALASITLARPVVVALDDLGRDGDKTLLLVSSMMRDPRFRLRCLFVATESSRTVDTPASMTALDALRVMGVLESIELAGLTHHEVQRLVTAEAPGVGTPTSDQPAIEAWSAGQGMAEARAMLNMTAGNPYLIRELISHRRQPDAIGLPGGVREFADRRLSGFSEIARSLMQAATVFEDPFSIWSLAELESVSVDEAAHAVKDLETAGLLSSVEPLEPGGPPLYRFRYGVMSEHLYSTMIPAKRRLRHQAAAEAARLEVGQPAYASARLIADQLVRSGSEADNLTAAAELWELAHTAPPDEAVKLCHQARELTSLADSAARVEATIELGAAMARAELPPARRLLIEGSVDALAMGRNALAASALVCVDAATVDELTPICADLLAELSDRLDREQDSLPDPLTHAQVLARTVADGASSNIADATLSTAADRLVAWLRTPTIPDDVPRIMRVADDLSSLAARLDDDHLVATAAHNGAMVAAVLGDDARVGSDLRVLERLHAKTPDLLPEYRAAAADWPTAELVRTGLWPSANVAPSWSTRSGFARSNLVVYGWLHDADLPADQNSLPPADPTDAIAQNALVALRQGDLISAELKGQGALGRLEAAPLSYESLQTAGMTAMVIGSLENPQLAERMITLLEPMAAWTCCAGYRSYAGPVSFHLGRLKLVVGDWRAAEAHLDRAALDLGNRMIYPWAVRAAGAMAEALGRQDYKTDRLWQWMFEAEASSASSSLADLSLSTVGATLIPVLR